jgi:hypothetical protein
VPERERRWLVGQLLRLAIGPVPTDTWLAFSPMEKSVGLAITMVLAAALLAAAIDWLLGPRLAPAPVADAGPGERQVRVEAGG